MVSFFVRRKKMPSSTFRQRLGAWGQTDPPARSRLSKKKLLDEARTTKSKKTRTRTFWQVFRRNLTSRQVTLVAALAVIPRTLVTTLDKAMFAPGTIRPGPYDIPDRNVPEAVRMLGINPHMVRILERIVKTTYDWGETRKIAARQAKVGVQAFILAQVMLALLQTIMEIYIFDKHSGKHDRALLQKYARALGVERTSTLTMDELRVAIAEETVALYSRQTQPQ